MRHTTLVRERPNGLEQDIWTDTFAHECSVNEVEQRLRDAVNEYLQTDEGKHQIELTCNDFNWGDAIMYVPQAIWQRHGLTLSAPVTMSIRVRQDEILC